MDAEQAKALREAFPPETIGKLPKLTCKGCSNAQFKVCDKHEKKKCLACGNFISTAHIDLDYVGHAAATDRLLKVDPEWTWEPVIGPELDALRHADSRGLWIKLTICGVSRYGFGDGPNGKEMIGECTTTARTLRRLGTPRWRSSTSSMLSARNRRSSRGRGWSSTRSRSGPRNWLSRSCSSGSLTRPVLCEMGWTRRECLGACCCCVPVDRGRDRRMVDRLVGGVDLMTATNPLNDRLPPLRPWVIGSKIAISCEKPGEFLIRAWTVKWHSPEKLVDWILHYVGRFDLADLEWWGYTYPGQPSYMAGGVDAYSSGLTIQRFAEPRDQWAKKMLDEGRIGPAYLPPDDLPIPERGIVQRCAAASVPSGAPE